MKLLNAIKPDLERVTGAISRLLPVGGGSINEAYKIEAVNGAFFLKVNDAEKYPGMFDAEADGLKLLREGSQFKIPEVKAIGSNGKTCFLLLQWVGQGLKSSKAMYQAGALLAGMHKRSNSLFGLSQDNYIGSLSQSNKQFDCWPAFFSEERLRPLLKAAIDKKLLNANILEAFERLSLKLDDVFPKEPPALLHGDLWSGNFMVSDGGIPCVFDPAVYYGHREMDIAMTKLFGGFSEEFYCGYTDSYPLKKGWEARIEICNLYPLLVHVLLFGGGYARQVEQIIGRF
jgi:protein-ribulosamine 3-kinase